MPLIDETSPAPVTRAELEQLRLDQRRFRWLLAVWAATCRDRPGNVIAAIDKGLADGASPLAVAGAAGAVVRGRKKSPDTPRGGSLN